MYKFPISFEHACLKKAESMGKRSKERNLVANATRRRPVLGINRVSRREVADGKLIVGATFCCFYVLGVGGGGEI